MDKLEVLCRAWIECDPNRALGAEPGSGFHPDDLMPARRQTLSRDEKGNVTGIALEGVSEELQGEPYWRWFAPRAVELENYLEQRGFVIVPQEAITRLHEFIAEIYVGVLPHVSAPESEWGRLADALDRFGDKREIPPADFSFLPFDGSATDKTAREEKP